MNERHCVNGELEGKETGKCDQVKCGSNFEEERSREGRNDFDVAVRSRTTATSGCLTFLMKSEVNQY